jgi:outer membrane scaffolding protein for murein synthesis (MipA/OmpV family)
MSETAKHTAGEWEASPWSSSVGAGVFAQPDPAENTRMIAAVPGEKEEAEANARLIASAPELLEALRVALTAMNYMGEIMNGMDIVMEEDEAVVNPAFKKSRAAIAKATGEDR